MARDAKTSEDFRVQLEGGAEILEIAAVRYRALCGMLGALLWRERLAQNADLIAAMCEAHGEVSEALDRATRLLRHSPSRELVKLTAKVADQLAKADALLGKRVGVAGDVERGLRTLLGEVAPTPKGEGREWRAARTLLPLSLPEIIALHAPTRAAKALAERPPPKDARSLPWNAEDVEGAASALEALDTQCVALWRLLPRPTEALLLQKLRSADSLPDDGPARLVRAEAARRALKTRAADAVAVFLQPLGAHDHEVMPLLRHLVTGTGLPEVRPASRAALMALAVGLANGPARDASEWERLFSVAAQVDEQSREARALLENLTLFLRIKQQRAGVRRPVPKTLAESLVELRALS